MVVCVQSHGACMFICQRILVFCLYHWFSLNCVDTIALNAASHILAETPLDSTCDFMVSLIISQLWQFAMQSLNMCPTVSSLSLHILHIISPRCLAILTLIALVAPVLDLVLPPEILQFLSVETITHLMPCNSSSRQFVEFVSGIVGGSVSPSIFLCVPASSRVWAVYVSLAVPAVQNICCL